MSRSLKKAPYVEEKLYTRICAMNEKNEKKVIKTWSRASTIFPEFVGHTIAIHDGKKHVMTAENTCRCTLPRIWSVTNWVSLRPPVLSAVTPVPRPRTLRNKGGS